VGRLVGRLHWAMAGFALSGVTLVSLGLVLISTWAFPDVGCSGDACWMTWNRVALPSIVIGAFLGVVAFDMFLRLREGRLVGTKIK